MGNIKSFLFKKPEPIRAIFLGLDASGKSSILYSLKLREVITTIPPFGFNVETLEHKGLNIIAWDVDGRDKIRPLHRHYFENTQIVIFVIDSNDRDRLEEAKNELHNICSEDQIKKSMLLVFANKQDLEGAMSVEEIKHSIDFDSISLQPKQIFGTVGYNKESLEAILDWIQDNYGKEGSQIAQPVIETYNDITEIAKPKSWIEYLKKITQQVWVGTK